MALVRCRDHRPDGRNYKYVKLVEAVDPPNEAIICGIKGCLKRGSVWLCEEEADAYDKGERYFSSRPSRVSGIKAKTGAKIRVC
jgi:hypothetical protein